MKTGIYLILLIVILTGCIVKKETYLIVEYPDKSHILSRTKRDTINTNRFEKQFYQADSTFNNMKLKFRE